MLDTYSRRVVRWSLDANQTAGLVTSALGMAIDTRRPPAGTVIHSDQEAPLGSWAFTERTTASGLVPSMGSVGDCYINSMIEAFWSRMPGRAPRRTSLADPAQLASAMLDYLEIWHNRQPADST